MRSTADYIYLIYRLFIFLLFMNAMYPWYMWNNAISRITLVLTVSVSVLLLIKKQKYFVVTSGKKTLLLCFFIAVFYHFLIHNGFTHFFSIIIWGVLLMLKKEFQNDILFFITKYFSLLLLISLISYILFLFGFHISPTYIEYLDIGYPTMNYYTFTLPVHIGDYIRFKSIFMEPGHLTMGIVPLIFANRFNLNNKYVRILFIIELFTFSLAGYITMFIGYFILNFTVSRLKILIKAALVMGIVIYVIEIIGMGDMLDIFLWNRLEYSDGTIAGDQRVSSEFENVYRQTINSDKCWFGNQNVDLNAYGGIAGIKKYIVSDGLIGVLSVVILYSCNYLMRGRKREIATLMIVQLLLLYQNSYPFWFCMISVYILGFNNLKYKFNESNIIFPSTKRLYRKYESVK